MHSPSLGPGTVKYHLKGYPSWGTRSGHWGPASGPDGKPGPEDPARMRARKCEWERWPPGWSSSYSGERTVPLPRVAGAALHGAHSQGSFPDWPLSLSHTHTSVPYPIQSTVSPRSTSRPVLTAPSPSDEAPDRPFRPGLVPASSPLITGEVGLGDCNPPAVTAHSDE